MLSPPHIRLYAGAPLVDSTTISLQQQLNHPLSSLCSDPVMLLHRFKENPLVLGPPHIRFYAGAPLIDSTGCRLGSLCVLDRQPRNFDAENCNVLCNFAEVVVREMEKDKRRVSFDAFCRLADRCVWTATSLMCGCMLWSGRWRTTSSVEPSFEVWVSGNLLIMVREMEKHKLGSLVSLMCAGFGGSMLWVTPLLEWGCMRWWRASGG